MIRIYPRSQGNVLGFECGAHLSHEDYTEILIPALKRVMAEHGVVNVLFDFTSDFKGYSIRAVLDDSQFGLKNFSRIGKVALVSAPRSMRVLGSFCNYVSKVRCQSFLKAQLEEAWAFVENLEAKVLKHP
jgi:hypothetical protein